MTPKPMSDAELKKQFEEDRHKFYAELYGNEHGKERNFELELDASEKADAMALDNLIASAKAPGREEGGRDIDKAIEMVELRVKHEFSQPVCAGDEECKQHSNNFFELIAELKQKFQKEGA